MSRFILSKKSAVCLSLALCFLGPLSLLSDEREEGGAFVEELRFEGNHSISSSQLREPMKTRSRRLFQIGYPPFYPDWLRSDLARIAALYHREGFYEVMVTSDPEKDRTIRPTGSQRNAVSLVIHVKEGKRRYLRSLLFEGPGAELLEEARPVLNLEEGKPLDPPSIEGDRVHLLEALKSKGYFWAEAGFRQEVIESPSYSPRDSLDLVFTLEAGPRAILSEIRIRGTLISRDFILKEMRVQEGEPLYLGELLQSEQNLLDTGLFRSISHSLIPRDPGENGHRKVDLLWEFVERGRGSLEFGLGYGSIDGYRILGNWSHRGLFSPGGRLNLELLHTVKKNSEDALEISMERQSLEYWRRNVISPGLHLSLRLFHEMDHEQPGGRYSRETLAFRMTLIRTQDADTEIYIREQQDINRQQPLIGSIEIPNSLTRSLSLIWNRDSRDHFFHPTEGRLLHLGYEVAGGLQGGDHHFQRVRISSNRYRKKGAAVFASRFRLGWVEAYGQSLENPLSGIYRDGVPWDERFYCGGSTSVRGYEDASLGPLWDEEEDPGLGNALGGRFLMVGNLELRQGLSSIFGTGFLKNLGLSLFLDAGNTWLDPGQLRGSELFPWQGKRSSRTRVYWSTGLGIHYLSPMTVVRLEYGLPLPARNRDERGRWHLSLGHSF
ncbi:MAG: BamA/TamA family outer membrane protein [Candidatus Krumholzibacteria bacterium]|nr:BamA/TamA family outer membrane protein [Candidatus Krumholzibacteria bacterium]